MTDELAAAIAAASDLAWRPMANITRGYVDRHESHRELVDRLALVTERPRDPRLRALLRARLRRAAVVSYANRMGRAYYERRRVVAELRGCLDAYMTAGRDG